MTYNPEPQLIVLTIFFSIIYFVYAIRKLLNRTIDLYDFCLLASLAGFPLAFIVLPSVAVFVGNTLGTTLPFTVMFGLLFVAVFISLHRIISRVHRLEEKISVLIQEIGIMQQQNRHEQANHTKRDKLTPAASRDISLELERSNPYQEIKQ